MLTIIKAGILDSVQDGGRHGFASLGINPGGVMDRFAASTANLLVGNEPGEAVIELHFPAMQVLFTEDVLISVCGADFSPAIHEEAISNWQPVMVNRNALLHFQKWKWGTRAYLAVHGGLKLNKWLNSYSTNIKAGSGGYKGRALVKDDELEVNKEAVKICMFNSARQYSRVMPWGLHDRNVYSDPGNLSMLPGPEWHLLDHRSKEMLADAVFTIAPSSDRMGCLLNGPSLHLQHPVELVSSGVDFGTIQLLPNGQLIILMADHQTTGGYPRIGNIVSAHLPKLAQMHAGSGLRLRPTNIHTAEQLLFSQMRDLRIIQRSCQDHIQQLYVHH